MIPKVPINVRELTTLLKQGERKTLEFKRSTGELREALQTVCAFLNGSGGIVLFPRGITPALLKRRHLSVQRNPIIADMFYRTGLIEKWGRGTNRVVEMCRATDIPPPTFEQIGLGAVVTFRVNVASTQPEAAPSRH